MRWWRVGVSAALLVWVLGAASLQARRRGRRLGVALVLLCLALLCFALAAFSPRPPLTEAAAKGLVILSVLLLALAMGVVLARGFGQSGRRLHR